MNEEKISTDQPAPVEIKQEIETLKEATETAPEATQEEKEGTE